MLKSITSCQKLTEKKDKGEGESDNLETKLCNFLNALSHYNHKSMNILFQFLCIRLK